MCSYCSYYGCYRVAGAAIRVTSKVASGISRAYIDGACVDGAYIDRAYTDGAYTDGACGDRVYRGAYCGA